MDNGVYLSSAQYIAITAMFWKLSLLKLILIKTLSIIGFNAVEDYDF